MSAAPAVRYAVTCPDWTTKPVSSVDAAHAEAAVIDTAGRCMFHHTVVRIERDGSTTPLNSAQTLV